MVERPKLRGWLSDGILTMARLNCGGAGAGPGKADNPSVAGLGG
jgi:hypothetical protein